MKPLEAFPPVQRGEAKVQTWCRQCFAAYGKEYYRKNREAQKTRLLRNTEVRRADNRQRAIGYLRSHPCVDCGETDIVVLQFDHVRDKKRDLARMINGGWTWAAIEREIAKCEVRCANCHRVKTALRHSERRPVRKPDSPRPEQLRIRDALPRVCRVCRVSKPLTEFPFRSRASGTRHWICLACQRTATRDWYVRRAPDAKKVDGYGTHAQESLVARVDEYLSSHPCVDCGEDNIVLLDFDHIREKTNDISNMIRDGSSWEQIVHEIENCAVRCANCHARVTALRIGAYRLATA
ncbi:MAG: hypothetical protein AABM40_07875 [Chloroflexota bacterium]